MKSKKDTVILSEQKCLYMVATPIGNLGDISRRAVEVFENVGWVAAEDTRQARKLFTALKISNRPKFFSIHAHSKLDSIERTVSQVGSEPGAYISDAGTPGISDPGGILVKVMHAKAWRICPVPGPSALAAIVSILDSESVLPLHFLGFFPRQSSEKEKILSRIFQDQGTYVFFESPNRILSTLEFFDSSSKLSQHQIVLGRELTKLHEEILRGTAGELKRILDKRDSIKGEIVFSLHSAGIESESLQMNKVKLYELANLFQVRGKKLDQKTFIDLAKALGWKRNAAYELGLQLQEEGLVT